MLRMSNMEENEEPSSTNTALSSGAVSVSEDQTVQVTSVLGKLKSFIQNKKDASLRDAIEEYIEEVDDENQVSSSVTVHERALIANILKLRDMVVFDVMIPRADISAIDINTSQKDLLSLLAEKQFSRLPVYKNTLDEVVGTIHIKDILACLARGERIIINNLIRDVPIISPSMHVLDLLLMMREKKKHMALVVDEFGGIDGLVTIGDVIESIVGEIEDEYENNDNPKVIRNADGSILADGRVDIEEFEDEFGKFLEENERDDDIDTLGGLVSTMAGRVPARGEILTHPSGLVFEIIEADPRRINRLKIKNLSLHSR